MPEILGCLGSPYSGFFIAVAAQAMPATQAARIATLHAHGAREVVANERMSEALRKPAHQRRAFKRWYSATAWRAASRSMSTPIVPVSSAYTRAMFVAIRSGSVHVAYLPRGVSAAALPALIPALIPRRASFTRSAR